MSNSSPECESHRRAFECNVSIGPFSVIEDPPNLTKTTLLSGSNSHSGDVDIGNNVVIVKLGGSSITEKGQMETLNSEALRWVAETLSSVLDPNYVVQPGQRAHYHFAHDNMRENISFILVHGAGSYGHWFAKQYGLEGKTQPPTHVGEQHQQPIRVTLEDEERRLTFHGLAKTRAR